MYNPSMRISIRSVLFLLALILAGRPSHAQQTDLPRPNVILIVTDDQGWADIGYHNDKVRTPNMDRLCEMGVELDAHYVQPQCTPTRVALLTGRYPSRFGPQATFANNEPAFALGTFTMARMFKELGYDTALMGKWHLGSMAEHGPNKFGFDYSYGSLAGAVGMYDHRYRIGSPYEITWHRDGGLIEGNEDGTHVTDLIADDAVRFLRQERDKPFFLYLPFHAVHLPIVENDEKWHAMNAHVVDDDRRAFLAAASHLDDAIGRIINAVDNSVALENTLVIFTSDNGGVHWAHPGGDYPAPDPKMIKGFSSNNPLRDGKITAYEGGIRVPAFVTWVGTLEPGKVGSRMHAVDWLPTLAHLLGYEPNQEMQWDGVNVWPIITGEREGYEQPRTIYTTWSNGRWLALHHGDMKIVRNRNKPWQLFDLSEDPNEKKNLAEEQPEKLAELIQRFEAELLKDK